MKAVEWGKKMKLEDVGACVDVAEVMGALRCALRAGGLISGVLADLVIVSEFWVEGSVVHVVVWVPDLDSGGLRWVRKRVVYECGKGVLEIKSLGREQ